MRVVVTGGHGFLGRHVERALTERGHVVFTFRSGEYDLVEGASCWRLVQDTKPDAIVHAAARVGGIGDNVQYPAEFLYENAMMGLQLMQAARLQGVSKFLTVGTECMYPADAPVPAREQDLWNGYPAAATAPYGQAKRLILEQGRAFATQYDYNAVFLILSNLYGPGDTTTHVIPQIVQKFTDAARDGTDVTLWGTGQPTRDFLYVEDAAEGIAAALEHYNSPEPVNLGTGVETPLYAVATAIAWELGFENRIRWEITRPEGSMRRALSYARAQEQFGWRPTTSFRQGLPRYLDWVKEGKK